MTELILKVSQNGDSTDITLQKSQVGVPNLAEWNLAEHFRVYLLAEIDRIKQDQPEEEK
jgi:hypothetical protein